MKEIYLDNAATSRPFKEVCDVMAETAYNTYGNPSSLHHLGFEAEKKMKEAIKDIASIIKVKPEDIVITSGATEGNNLAIIGCALANKRRGNHLITSKGEHPAVLEVFAYLEEIGFEVTYLNLNKQGQVTKEEILKSLRKDTILVSVMHVNNEIGTIQNLEMIAKTVKEFASNIIVHSDCTQSYGKYVIYPSKINVDLITTSAHKFHGPRGIGFLYKNSKVKMNPLIFGGGQQKGVRSGTENVPGLVAMAKASSICYEALSSKNEYLKEIKNYFIEGLEELNSKNNNELLEFTVDNNNDIAPYILSVSFAPVRSEVLLHTLEESGIYVSSGSACATNHPGISSVLQAIGVEKKNLDSTIRFSFSLETTKEDIDYTLNIIGKTVPMLRKFTRR